MTVQKMVDYGDYKKIALFNGMKEEHIRAILPCLEATERTYKKDEIIIMNQEDVRYVGIVIRGKVHMISEDFWGNKSIYSFFCEGELFGESFAVQESTQSDVTFVAASSEVKVLFLSLLHVMRPCPRRCSFHVQIAENLYRELGRKNILMMEKISVISKPDLKGKILAYLSIQARKQNSRYIKSPLGRTEMADYLGANRSAMTRTLSIMRDEGIIDFDRNTFILKKPHEQEET